MTLDVGESLVGLGLRLEIHLEDSTTEIETLALPLGEPSNPLSDEHVLKEFNSMAVLVYGPQKAERTVQVVEKLDEYPRTGDSMSVLA